MAPPAPAPLPCALLGCGQISQAHLRALQASGFSCVAYGDVDRARAEARRAEFGPPEARIYTSAAELLAHEPAVRLVIIATTPHTHEELTLAALAAGKAVYCEKPATFTVAAMARIAREADARGLFAAYTPGRLRSGPAAHAHDLLAARPLGRLYHGQLTYWRSRGRPGVDTDTAPWFRDLRLAGGGIIPDMGMYFMDMTLNLCGWPAVESVAATTFRGVPHLLPAGTTYDVEEHATLLVRCTGDLTLVFDLANISLRPEVSALHLLGTEGALEIRHGRDGGCATYREVGGPWRLVREESLYEPKKRGDELVYPRLRAALEGAPLAGTTTHHQMLALTEIVAAAYRSAAEGRTVPRAEVAAP